MFTNKTITGFANKRVYKTLLAAAILSTLTACPFDGDSNSNNDNDQIVTPAPAPTEYTYQVEVTNLTYAQPMSPIGVALHGDEVFWQIGEPSSVPLEILAEGGDNTDFLAQEMMLVTASSDGILMPGVTTTIDLTTTDETATHFTLATMLVNTNDAFSGLTGIDLSNFELDSSRTWRLASYDAGTEANTEGAGTIPGPADGGLGYSGVRDDVDYVSYHPGVVSQDDGLSTSVLTQAHRFDNPTLKVTITRTK